MIEALKSDEIVNKMGGRFKLTALVQRRLKELIVDGARPLVDRHGRTDLELVIEEILQDKIGPMSEEEAAAAALEMDAEPTKAPSDAD
jgi:DNA-directed RNA polymerase subunit omega